MWFLLLFGTTPLQARNAAHNALQEKRWVSASIPKHRLHEVSVTVARIERNRARYEAVEKRTGVPWRVIAGLHNMEASGSFSKHLHEGSPLTARTRYVPKGRPKTGNPPFMWEASAVDALEYDQMGKKDWRQIGTTLSACEGYNGWGYAVHHPETPSPYLWAATSVEKPGKYVSDGKWSSTARSSQIGIAALLKLMAQ
jgi:lysozyme family protein